MLDHKLWVREVSFELNEMKVITFESFVKAIKTTLVLKKNINVDIFGDVQASH